MWVLMYSISQSKWLSFLYVCSENPSAAQQLIDQPGDGISVLNGLDWEGNPQLAVSLQNSIFNSTVYGICANENVRHLDNTNYYC